VSTVSSKTSPPDPWGEDCVAWRLLAGPDLAVAEEMMPPGTSEVRHVHRRARQFFYVLEGRLAMERPEGIIEIEAGEGLEMAPGVPHRAHNPGGQAVRFLVISAPTAKGDRDESG
jgi:mannose-6-phosphate isomerase-like protein (cupin superfamily)